MKRRRGVRNPDLPRLLLCFGTEQTRLQPPTDPRGRLLSNMRWNFSFSALGAIIDTYYNSIESVAQIKYISIEDFFS